MLWLKKESLTSVILVAGCLAEQLTLWDCSRKTAQLSWTWLTKPLGKKAFRCTYMWGQAFHVSWWMNLSQNNAANRCNHEQEHVKVNWKRLIAIMQENKNLHKTSNCKQKGSVSKIFKQTIFSFFLYFWKLWKNVTATASISCCHDADANQTI